MSGFSSASGSSAYIPPSELEATVAVVAVGGGARGLWLTFIEPLVSCK